jgi:hypothetical protein
LTTNPIGPVPQATRTILAAVLSLASFVFIFGMPWNDLGLWRQTEVPAALIHFAAALVTFLLGFLVFRKDEETVGLLRHPAVLAIIALALFTAAVSPLTESPWRSIHGTLKHGIGALWHLELALFIVASALVLRSRAALILETALVLSTTAVVALYAFPETDLIGWPMSFAEWVGLLAAAVAFVVVSRNRSILSIRTGIALALLAGGIYVSENRAVMLSVAASLIVVAACRLPVLSTWFSSARFRAAFVIVAGLVGVATMAAVAPLIESAAITAPAPAGTEMVLSDNPLDRQTLQEGVFGTLWSRSHMVLMVLGDLAEHPAKLVTGQGWGSFATVYEYHAREVPGRLFPMPLPTSSQTYWDAQKMSDFHSHDLPVEALLSGGIVAFILWFAAIGSVAATSRTGLVAATGVMVGSLFWFPVNHMTIAIAVLLACGVAPVAVSERALKTISQAVAIPVAIVCAIFMTAGAQIFTLAWVEHNERYFQAIEADRNPETCSSIATVMLPEDEVNISLYEVLTQRILRTSNRPKEVYDRTTNLLTLTCTLRSYYQNGDNIRALVASLEKRAVLVGIGPASYGPMVDDIVNWGKDVDRLLAMAPQRTEHVVPYLSALVQRSKNTGLILSELDRIIAKLPPSDPVTVYVEAMRARQLGDNAGYLRKLKKAVSLGYANIYSMPLDKAKELGLK